MCMHVLYTSDFIHETNNANEKKTIVNSHGIILHYNRTKREEGTDKKNLVSFSHKSLSTDIFFISCIFFITLHYVHFYNNPIVVVIILSVNGT